MREGGGGGIATIAMQLYSCECVYLYSVVKNPLTAKRGVLQSNLRITDMQSLYPWNGISDAVVDFYIRSASVSCTCIMAECLHNLVEKFCHPTLLLSDKMTVSNVC